MDLKINLDPLRNLNNDSFKIDNIKFQKMVLLFNAIEDGWEIKKKKDSYVFTKKHEGKKEIFEENYLQHFMKDNFDMKTIF